MSTRSAAAAAQVQVSTLASPPRATEDVAAAAAPAALDPPAAPRAGDGDDEACGEDFEAADAVTSQPVTQAQPLQIGSRVSVQAKCFDTKHGEQWSTKVFGDGGTQTRVYGLVRELGSNAGGRGTTYLCDWDIAVPVHDPERAGNARCIGRREFPSKMLRKEEPAAGRRSGAQNDNPLVARPEMRRDRQQDADAAADDEAVAAPTAATAGTVLFKDMQQEDDGDSALVYRYTYVFISASLLRTIIQL